MGSGLLSLEQLAALSPTHKTVRCKACSNHCLLTVNDFGVDETTGKASPLHHGQPLREGRGHARREPTRSPTSTNTSPAACSITSPLAENAPRGTVGILARAQPVRELPVLGSLSSKLGWRVVLSDPSTKKTYEAGIESMPSESVCYPAKLSHATS